MGGQKLGNAAAFVGIAGVFFGDHHGRFALVEQRPLNGESQCWCLFAIAGNDCRLLGQAAFAFFYRNRIERFAGLGQACNHSCTNGDVGQPVNHDKAAGSVVALVGIEGDRLVQGQFAKPNLV